MSIVEPKDGAVEVAPADSAETPTTGKSTTALSDELLQIPALQAIFSGAPPAVSAPIETFQKRPEAKLIMDHRDQLMRAGMGLYRSLGGDIGVLFNRLKISDAEIQTADQQGKLLDIAPPFDQINASTGQSGGANPVMTAQVPGGAATPPVPTPSQTNSAVRGPAPQQTRARLKNLVGGGPATGPKPGAGRLLNSILRPVV